MIITTQRLALVPLTPDLIAAQQERHPSFFSMLSAAPRTDWPPPHYDGRALQWTLDRLDAGEDASWHTRLVVTRKPPQGLSRVLGVAGFKGAPDARGEVEIAYSIVASEQRQGFGAEAVDALIGFALDRPEVRIVSAL